MIDITFFGLLLGTLGSALSVVMLIVALSSVTYLAMTLVTALRALPGAVPDRAARLLGLTTALGTAVAAFLGLRVGAAGSGGEFIPSLAVSVAGAAALGSAAACALTAARRGLLLVEGPRRRKRELREGEEQERARALESRSRRRLEGADLQDEIAESEAALRRLEGALDKLEETRRKLAEKLETLGVAGAGPERLLEYRKALDELTMKLELGAQIRAAAQIAAFRLACNEPLRRLARRRPREATLDLGGTEGTGASGSLPRLEAAAASITAFLAEIEEAHLALEALAPRRPEGIVAGSDEDPLDLALGDLDSLDEAYHAVLERIEVIGVRRSAQATLDEVADAAGALSGSAKAQSSDAAEIQELAAEVAHAESAMAMATPEEADTKALTVALARSTAALGRSDGASLDELLKALRTLV